MEILMSNIKKEAEKTMKFIIKKGVIYKLERITEDGIMMYKAINGCPSSNRENTQFYEDVCDTYNIQFIKNNENPVQYFFRKINEATNTVWEKTIESPALIGYLKAHKSDEECAKAVVKLKDIIKAHPYIEVKKAAYRTCEEVGVDNIEELSIYINEYNPNAYMYDFNEELPGSPTKHFIVNVKNSSYNTLHLVKNQKFIKYLELYKDKCPKTIDLLIELVKTNQKQKIRSSAYSILSALKIENIKDLQVYAWKNTPKTANKKTYKSSLYNPPVGEFGFCCEEEKMAILFSSIKEKNWDNYDTFKSTFATRYREDASIQTEDSLKALYDKYYQYAIDGKFKEIQMMRGRRINSTLPEELLKTLDRFDLRVTRADGRGTSKVVKKCRRKKQYNKDRLSGFRIIAKKNGKVFAGKKYELYEEDVKAFCDKLLNGEITLNYLLVGDDE